MSFDVIGLWPFLVAESIRRFIDSMARMMTRCKSASVATFSTPRHPEVRVDGDPLQLSRSQLLSELLAPAVEPFELFRVCDIGAAQPLPPEIAASVSRRLLVARELMRRDMLAALQGTLVLNSPKKLAEWLHMHCGGLDYEVFLVLYLDAQHRLITAEQLFRGTLTQTSVYPREVLKQALRHKAAALALAHNHPSGGVEPSSADKRLTADLKNALSLIDVRVLDHIIVGGENHYSFAENGLI